VSTGTDYADAELHGVYERLERRIVAILTGLNLRRAVGLIVTTATTLALTAAVIVRIVDPAIGTFGDALWWAVTTVTTVGYGDVVPESTTGRLVGAALMLTGLGLIPIISILVSQRTRETREAEMRNLDKILERIDELEQRVLAQRAS
jgi:voltage-gated potassium channel